MRARGKTWALFAPWLALPLLLGCFGLWWERLPEQVVVQVTFSGAAADTMPRGVFLAVSQALLIFVLGQFTLRLGARRDSPSAADYVVYFAAVGVLTGVFLWVLRYNLA